MSDWFKLHRQEWILEMVEIYGFINQKHVMKKFRISKPQAAIDFKEVLEKHPKLIKYNTSTRRYERTKVHERWG